MATSALFNYYKENWKEHMNRERLADYLTEGQERYLETLPQGYLMKVALGNMFASIAGRQGSEMVLRKMLQLNQDKLEGLQDLLIKHGALEIDETDGGVWLGGLKGEELEGLSQELCKQFVYEVKRMSGSLTDTQKDSLGKVSHGHLIKAALNNMIKPVGESVGPWGAKRVLDSMAALDGRGLLAFENMLSHYGAWDKEERKGGVLEGKELEELSEKLHKYFPYKEQAKAFRSYAGQNDYDKRAGGSHLR